MSSPFFLLARIDEDSYQVIKENNYQYPQKAASLIKVFYALEVLRRLEEGLIKDQPIKITSDAVSDYGTNILVDLMGDQNEVWLNIQTLVGLMVKYSCNSSTDILLKNCLPEVGQLNEIAKNVWDLKTLKMDNQNKLVSLDDLAKLFIAIFGSNPKLKKYNQFLKEKLKTSRNIYYLFDQLEVKVLGSKSGTLQKDNAYFINDSGVIEINGKVYFIGVMISDLKISVAVIKARQIGKDLVESLKSH